MKKVLLIILLIIIPTTTLAKEITNDCDILVSDRKYTQLTDDNYTTYQTFNKTDEIIVSCSQNIKYVYISYHSNPVSGNIYVNKDTIKLGKYLHELSTIENESTSFSINYDNAFAISDIYIFDDNDELPSWVQKWETLSKADMILFSSHADDEQLFFAGLLPLYADKGYDIQVVYYTKHFNDKNRYHEQLDGLWAVGIKYYPVISEFPDAYSESLNGAITNLENAGFSVNDAIDFQVEQILKYQPNVVVGHDEKGEYSHGQHILNTHTLKEAIVKAKTFDKSTYEPWEVKKVYLHLYEQNKIVLDLDNPLASFEGKTAYEVAKIGYSYHLSQQYTWFTDWLNGKNNSYTSATQINTYSPCEYGLYYSSVGEDINKNDMFENIFIEEEKIPPKKINQVITTVTSYFYYVIGGTFIIIVLVSSLTTKKKKD